VIHVGIVVEMDHPARDAADRPGPHHTVMSCHAARGGTFPFSFFLNTLYADADGDDDGGVLFNLLGLAPSAIYIDYSTLP
jgi:hypothetical protein